MQTKSINKTEQLLLEKITQEREKKYLKQKTIKTGKLRTKIFSLERLLLISPSIGKYNWQIIVICMVVPVWWPCIHFIILSLSYMR